MIRKALTSDDGFTLMEAVISLMVVSLSLAALLAVANLSVRTQKAVVAERTDARAAAAERARLATALGAVEPVTETGFVGSNRTLAAVRAGGASVIYSARPGFRLRYVGEDGVTERWPGSLAAGQDQAAATHRRLRAVILSDSHGAPVAVVSLRADLSQACRFDAASQTCRETGA